MVKVGYFFVSLQTMTDEEKQEHLQRIELLERTLTRNDYAQDIAIYNDMAVRYRILAVAEPQQYEPKVATMLRHAAYRHVNLKQYTQAEKLYREALELFRRLAQQWPQGYEAEVANVLCRLSLLHYDENAPQNSQHPHEAEQELQEALDIYRRLAVRMPRKFTYKQEAAAVLFRLAALHKTQPQQAIAELDMALELYRELAQWSPTAFESNVAQTLVRLSTLHEVQQNLTEAAQACNEALVLLRHLLQKKPHLAPTIADLEKRLTVLKKKGRLRHLACYTPTSSLQTEPTGNAPDKESATSQGSEQSDIPVRKGLVSALQRLFRKLRRR